MHEVESAGPAAECNFVKCIADVIDGTVSKLAHIRPKLLLGEVVLPRPSFEADDARPAVGLGCMVTIGWLGELLDRLAVVIVDFGVGGAAGEKIDAMNGGLSGESACVLHNVFHLASGVRVATELHILPSDEAMHGDKDNIEADVRVRAELSGECITIDALSGAGAVLLLKGVGALWRDGRLVKIVAIVVLNVVLKEGWFGAEGRVPAAHAHEPHAPGHVGSTKVAADLGLAPGMVEGSIVMFGKLERLRVCREGLWRGAGEGSKMQREQWRGVA